MLQIGNFACHNIHLETERLTLRPFKDADLILLFLSTETPNF